MVLGTVGPIRARQSAPNVTRNALIHIKELACHAYRLAIRPGKMQVSKQSTVVDVTHMHAAMHNVNCNLRNQFYKSAFNKEKLNFNTQVVEIAVGLTGMSFLHMRQLWLMILKNFPTRRITCDGCPSNFCQKLKGASINIWAAPY